MKTPEQVEAAISYTTRPHPWTFGTAGRVLYREIRGPEQCSDVAARILAGEVRRLRAGIIATLDANKHLADGDVCTLKELKSLVPAWEKNL